MSCRTKSDLRNGDMVDRHERACHEWQHALHMAAGRISDCKSSFVQLIAHKKLALHTQQSCMCALSTKRM